MKLNENNIQMFVRETSEKMSLKDHLHNYYEMVFVNEGVCQFKVDEKSYSITKPSLIFINHLENHSMNVLETPYKTYYLMIEKDTFQALLEEPILYSIFKYRPDNFSHVVPLTENKAQIMNIIDNMYLESQKHNPISQLAFKSLIQYLFIILHRQYKDSFPSKMQTQIHNTVIDVQEYIDKNYQKEIGLDLLSELFFISSSYLSRSFKEITGYNLKQYIILQRLSKAKELLLYSHDTTLEICEKSGFNNVNHFIRSFKDHHGITPNDFRHQERNDK